MRNERNQTNVMRNLAILLFIASAALNACFIAGCSSLHDAVYGKPCKYASVPSANDSCKAELVHIAELMQIKTDGKTVADLESDIRYELERHVAIPSVYPEFEEMAKTLGSKQKEAMWEYQNFITDLQGKRVIVIAPDAE